MSNTTNITGEVTGHLVTAFEFFNKELGTGLDAPVFTLIPNRGRQSYYGWYWQGRWKDGKKTLPEINITADTLKRSVEDICETLIHEMVHYKNNVEDIVDCNANQYHNKAFKTRAEAFGLTVERVRNRGYARTALGEKAAALVNKYKKSVLKNEKNPFHAYRIGSESRTSTVKSTKRFVAIDRALAEEAESIDGDTIKNIVENLLRIHVQGGSIVNHITTSNSERHSVEELA
jgi:hypothetical protein